MIAWAALGLLLSLGAQLLFEYFWLRAAFAAVAWVLIAVLLIVHQLWRARRPELRREALASAGTVVFLGILVAATSPFIAQTGASWTENFRFSRNRPLYEEVVREVGPSPQSGRHQRGDLIYLVEAGPPLRIAFPWPGGGVSGWCGAIYDPSGEVMRANDLAPDHSNWDDPKLEPVRLLFGGNLTDCHALGEEYYLCCFERQLLEAEE